MINPVKVRMGLKKVKRKVGSITEVIPKNSDSARRDSVSDEVSLETIFKYDRLKDEFYPNTVKSLLENTNNKRLKDAFKILGIRNPKANMKKRIEILRKCATSNATSPTQVLEIISEYYTN